MFFEKRRFSIEFNFQIKDFFLDEIPTNPCSSWGFVLPIIPYQVITGNYNYAKYRRTDGIIIPYQVITGNYNRCGMGKKVITIIPYQVITGNYNKERDMNFGQGIIPYQVITGNYNNLPVSIRTVIIIPYQVITGNYNLNNVNHDHCELYHTK